MVMLIIPLVRVVVPHDPIQDLIDHGAVVVFLPLLRGLCSERKKREIKGSLTKD